MAWTTAAGLGCVSAQLVTFDAGIMSFIASLGALALLALGTMTGFLRHANFSLRRLGYIALCLVGSTAAANLVLALFFWLTAQQPVGFTDYHYYSWRLIEGYNRSFGERLALEPLCAALIVSAILYVCISIAAGWKDWSDGQRALVVCVGALAIVGFKSAIVRATMGKVFMSSVPLLYLAAVLVSARMTPWRFRPMEAGLCLLLVSSWPFRAGVEALMTFAQTAQAGPSELVAAWRSPFTYRIDPQAVVPPGLRDELAPGSRVLAFPYGNVMAVAINRPHVSPFLQPYAATDMESQKYFVERATAVRSPTEVIYAFDDWAVGYGRDPDITPNVTQSPVVFDYIRNQFTPKTGVVHGTGYVSLRPRESPTPLPASDLRFSVRTEGKATIATLANPAHCSMLKVTARVAFPFVAAFGRPTPMRASVMTQGRPVFRGRIPTLSSKEPFETYLPLVAGQDFLRILEWPDTRGPLSNQPLDQVRFEPSALDAFDVYPSRVDLIRLACVATGDTDSVWVQPDADGPLGEIVAGWPVRQDFVTNRDGLAGVSVQTAAYGRKNTGPVVFTVLAAGDDREQTLLSLTKDAQSIADNGWLTLWFPAAPKGVRRFALVIDAPKSAPGNAITLWLRSGDPYRRDRCTRDR